MQNFAAIAEAFLNGHGALQVRDAAELETTLGELLADKNLRETLGRNALKVVQENRGAIDRTVDLVVTHLAGGERPIPPE